jgi:hypothetical protein
MSTRLFAYAAAAVLLAGSASSADDKPAAAPAAPAAPAVVSPASGPAAELTALDFLSGAFTCKGTWHNEAGVAVAKQSKFHSAWKLDNHFLEFSYEQKKSKEQPNHIAAIGYFGWDGAKNKYVHNAINNRGLTVTLYAEPGGDALVFKGEGSAASSASATGPISFTFKKAEKGFTITTSMEHDGKTAVVSEETCSK